MERQKPSEVPVEYTRHFVTDMLLGNVKIDDTWALVHGMKVAERGCRVPCQGAKWMMTEVEA